MELLDELNADLQRIEQNRTFQPGEAARLPATKQEEAAVARWLEVDKRRYLARATGEPFHYTPAERQLKQRLLRAGLIIVKPQPKMSRRERRQVDQKAALAAAKAFAKRGDVNAAQHVKVIENERKQAAWLRRQRMLRRCEPRELLDAIRDVMAARNIQRPLAALWREFTEGLTNATDDKRDAFLGEIRGDLKSLAGES